LGKCATVRFFFAAFAAFLMFLRAARRCFDDAIFVTSISILGLTLRYRVTAKQQTWEIHAFDRRRRVDAFRLKGVARNARQTSGNYLAAAPFAFESHCGTMRAIRPKRLRDTFCLYIMSTILLIILILLLIGALPSWPYSRGWGYYPSGGLGLILVIVIILALLGAI
jgi:Protein of unknown function (DUF3309)